MPTTLKCVITLGRSRRCSWNAWAFSFGEISSTRNIVWVSAHTLICLVRRTNSCSLPAEISTSYKFDAPRTPLQSFSINSVLLLLCVAKLQPPTFLQRCQLQCSTMGSLSMPAIYRRILCCKSLCTAAKPPTLLLPIHHIARPFTAPASTVTAPQF